LLWIPLSIGPILFFWFWYAGQEDQALIVLGFLTIPVSIWLMFYCMKVVVENGELRIAFGIGLIAFTYPLHLVEDCRPVRNKWYHGLGIKMRPQGMLYNIRGLKAIELELSNGRLIRVGSDEPEEFCKAIRAQIPQRPA